MSLTHRYTPSGVHVVESASDFRTIDADLRAIDDRLFLTWEVEQGRKVYRVLYDRGDEPPAEITRWPHELSSGLVDKVKALRPREGVDLRASEKANAAHEARQRADIDYAFDEIARDIGPRLRETRSVLLHRGAHLRRSRDKRRARGENV